MLPGARVRTVVAMSTDHTSLAELLRASGGRRYAVVLAVDAVGGGLLRPFLLLYAITVLHLRPDEAGLAITAGLLAGLAVLPLVGQWIDRGARSGVVSATLFIRGVGTVVLLVSDHPVTFFAATVLQGMGSQAFGTAHGAVIATLTTGRSRDAALAATRSLRNAGLGVGALAATLAVAHGDGALRWLAAIDSVALLVAGALVLPMRLVAPPRTATTVAARGALRQLTPLLLANLPYALCFAVLEVVLPALIVTHLHQSPAWSAAMFIANTALVVLAQVVVVRHLSRWPRSTVLAASGVVLSLSYLGFWAAGTLGGVAAAGALATICVLYTIGEIMYAGSSTGLVIAAAPPELLGQALARFQLCYGLGVAVAPALLTALLTVGTAVLWLTLTGLTMLAVAAVVARSSSWDSSAAEARAVRP